MQRIYSEKTKERISQQKLEATNTGGLRKLRTTSSIERTPGSGRSRSSRSADNIVAVDQLVQSQEGKPQTHLSTRQISREYTSHKTRRFITVVKQ